MVGGQSSVLTPAQCLGTRPVTAFCPSKPRHQTSHHSLLSCLVAGASRKVMVFINNQKFACESCIKGHRSSSCNHNDRPLFEVKKKGRPVSQCERCRELRKTKRVHSKCECVSCPPEQPLKKQLSVKSKRYIAVTPTLPNGVKDAVASTSSSMPPDPRARVASLLNPCHCKDVWSCTCRDDGASSSIMTPSTDSASSSGLAALAQAAALRCDQGGCTNPQEHGALPNIDGSSEQLNRITSSPLSQPGCCGSRSRANLTRSKRQRRSPSPIPPRKQLRGPDLPPIRQASVETELPSHPAPPQFPDIPPLSCVTSIAGSGCSCGLTCNCPGCIEHRGAAFVSKGFSDCNDGCGTFVDESLRELPHAAAAGSPNPGTPSTSFIDAFFAKAASLPLPPTQRTQGINIDPTNVTVYPTNLFNSESGNLEIRGAAFGLVKLPKLQCCAGKCGCAGGTCGCGTGCRGCCEENQTVLRSPVPTNAVPLVVNPSPIPTVQATSAKPVRSCCTNKVSTS